MNRKSFFKTIGAFGAAFVTGANASKAHSIPQEQKAEDVPSEICFRSPNGKHFWKMSVDDSGTFCISDGKSNFHYIEVTKSTTCFNNSITES
jgi:hypothetical protein